MTGTADKFSPFVIASSALHAGLVAFFLLAPLLFPSRRQSTWGTESSKDTASVGVVRDLPGVPLPSPPVTREDAPATTSKTLNPAEATPKAPEKVADADIEIPSGTPAPKKPERPQPPARATAPSPAVPDRPNAVPGDGGQVALPFGQGETASGPATFGDAAFGTRFPDYVGNMTRAVRNEWRDPIAGGRTISRVYVTFTIERDGKTRDLKIERSSGLAQLDNSAMRAVLAAKIPSLPTGYSGSSVEVRFYFEYGR